MFSTDSAATSQHVATRFDDVTVYGASPSPELVQANVTRSVQALELLGKQLLKPGVHLAKKKDVPRYEADENTPGVFIRSLNGEITSGRLQNGQFVENK